MAQQNNEKIIEALLFATDKPLSAAILAQVLEIPHKAVIESIDAINARLKENNSPIMIKQIAGGYEFLTLPEYAPHIKKLYRSRFMTRLSRPGLEVLAIVAYKQPVTKQEVEAIRGVNSDGVYYTLLERNLIKIAGRKDAPGRPLLYGTTKEFLQYLGINSLEDLPKIEEIQSILEKDEHIESWEDRVEVAKNQTMMEFDEEERQKLKERSKAVTDEEIDRQIEESEDDEEDDEFLDGLNSSAGSEYDDEEDDEDLSDETLAESDEEDFLDEIKEDDEEENKAAEIGKVMEDALGGDDDLSDEALAESDEDDFDDDDEEDDE